MNSNSSAYNSTVEFEFANLGNRKENSTYSLRFYNFYIAVRRKRRTLQLRFKSILLVVDQVFRQSVFHFMPYIFLLHLCPLYLPEHLHILRPRNTPPKRPFLFHALNLICRYQCMEQVSEYVLLLILNHSE